MGLDSAPILCDKMMEAVLLVRVDLRMREFTAVGWFGLRGKRRICKDLCSYSYQVYFF